MPTAGQEVNQSHDAWRIHVKAMKIFIACIAACSFYIIHPVFSSDMDRVTSKTIWEPQEKTIDAIKKECASLSSLPFTECFMNAMARQGASPEAIQFMRRTDNMAYVRDLRTTGGVDIAYVCYPMRANENYGYFLVNGVPSLVDVDDIKNIPLDELRKEPVYISLKKKYPDMSLFPADRYGTKEPVTETQSNGNQSFLVFYRLTSGCRACKEIGGTRIAFDFDKKGNFLGSRVYEVTAKADREVKVIKIFHDTQHTINLSAGEEFILSLDSNPTTGYRWELQNMSEEGIVALVGTEFKRDEGNLIGQGGKEYWTFRAIKEGITIITMVYRRPWEKETSPLLKTTIIMTVR